MKLRKRVRAAGKWIAVGALISATGCGAPAEQEAPGESAKTAAQALVVGVDFTVAEVSAPTGVAPGQSFPVRVKVCNQGTVPGTAGVEVFLSSNKHIEATDTSIGSLPPLGLAPGACATREVQASTAIAEGTYFIGAIADLSNQVAEADETNNARAGGRLGVGYRADFVVKALRAPVNVRPGESSAASVTVCNQGTLAESVELALVLSEDTDIALPGSASGDQLLMLFGGYFLEPGQCRTGEAFFIAPDVPEGAYYLGVIADSPGRVQEFFETNNTRASKAMGIGLKPDLALKEVLAPANVLPWSGFGASVTVCNEGTTGTPAEVEFFLSTDEVISSAAESPTPDFPLGTLSLGWLEPGQCATKDAQLSSNVPGEGTWYLGAVANAHSLEMEFNASNNTWGGEPMGIGYGPDFIVKAIQGEASILPGQDPWVFVTVCNQGTQPGDPEVELFASEDEVISGPGSVPADLSLGRAFVGSLMPGQCVTQRVPTSTGVPEGTYHLGAIVDPDGWVTELQEGNNARTGELLGVGYKADFIVKSVRGPTIARPGVPFTVSVMVCNQGTVDDVARVKLVLSSDKVLDASSVGSEQERLLADVDLGVVTARTCVLREVSVDPGSLPTHSWYLGALVGSGSGQQEFIESNNTQVGSVMGIGDAPDLVVRSIQAPATVRPGEWFDAAVTVCNQGSQESFADVVVVLSVDTALSLYADANLGSIGAPLSAGQCITQNVRGSAPMQGSYYVGAIVDPMNWLPELLESNNTRLSGPVGVGDGPDFVVKEVSVPASVRPGQGFTAEVTVCNQGTMADSTDVALVRSQDKDISPRDAQGGAGFLASAYVDFLAPGQCSTVRMPVLAQAASQAVSYVGAIADPFGSRMELLESNNTRASAAMGIGDKPDFVVKELRGPANMKPGEQYFADVKVCNQGTMAGFTQVSIFGTQEREFSGAEGWTGTEAFLGGLYLNWLEAGQCVMGPVLLSPSSGQSGVFYLGAAADLVAGMFELNGDNNVRIGEPLALGEGPDLVVKEVSDARLTGFGESTADVTVCNQGSLGGAASVAMLASSVKDSPLSLPLVPSSIKAQQDLGYLEAGHCVTRAISSPAVIPDGMQYLIFVADPFAQTEELLEGNNIRASSPVFVNALNTAITGVSAPAVVHVGEPVSVEVSLCGSSQVSQLELFLRPEEGSLGAQSLGVWPVNPSYELPCTSFQVSVPSLPEGLWRLRARAPTLQDPLPSDNERDSGLVVVRP